MGKRHWLKFHNMSIICTTITSYSHSSHSYFPEFRISFEVTVSSYSLFLTMQRLVPKPQFLLQSQSPFKAIAFSKVTVSSSHSLFQSHTFFLQQSLLLSYQSHSFFQSYINKGISVISQISSHIMVYILSST